MNKQVDEKMKRFRLGFNGKWFLSPEGPIYLFSVPIKATFGYLVVEGR